MSNLRGTVNVWDTKNTQGSSYGYSTPIKEDPSRAMTQLYNLAKGHALSQGRDYLTMEDIPLLIKVVLSTASIERVMVFDLLLAHNGTITALQLVKSLKISKPTALRTMVELKILELVSGEHFDIEEQEDEHTYSRLPSVHDKNSMNEKKTITLNKEFEWFLSDEFKNLREGFIPDGKSKYDDKIDKVEVEVEEESVKKFTPYAQQKKLFEEQEHMVSHQTKQSQPVPALVKLTQFPMLPLLRPILYLPLIGQQTKAKEEHPITIKDFNNSNNQDILHDSPLINIENITTTNSNLDTQNKKALMHEPV